MVDVVYHKDGTPQCSQCNTGYGDAEEAEYCCTSCVDCGFRQHGMHERAAECCPCYCSDNECFCDENGFCCQDYLKDHSAEWHHANTVCHECNSKDVDYTKVYYCSQCGEDDLVPGEQCSCGNTIGSKDYFEQMICGDCDNAWIEDDYSAESFEAMDINEQGEIICSSCGVNVEDDPHYATLTITCSACGGILEEDDSYGPLNMGDYYGAEDEYIRCDWCNKGIGTLEELESGTVEYLGDGPDIACMTCVTKRGIPYGVSHAESKPCGDCGRPATHSARGGTVNRCDRCWDVNLRAESFEAPRKSVSVSRRKKNNKISKTISDIMHSWEKTGMIGKNRPRSRKSAQKMAIAVAYSINNRQTTKKAEDEEPEYSCDICGKPAKYNFQDTTVRYEIVDDEDFENPMVSEYGGQNQNDFYCEAHANQYEGSDFLALRSEEGSTPIMPPMEFGEMANWRPLDGTPGLKRKRAEDEIEMIECGNCKATFSIDEGLDIGGIDYCEECYDSRMSKEDQSRLDAENYKHECITCGEGMDDLVAKGQTWSCECCGFLVGTQGKHEGCGFNNDGEVMCNLCYTGQCDCAQCEDCGASEGGDIEGCDTCEIFQHHRGRWYSLPVYSEKFGAEGSEKESKLWVVCAEAPNEIWAKENQFEHTVRVFDNEINAKKYFNELALMNGYQGVIESPEKDWDHIGVAIRHPDYQEPLDVFVEVRIKELSMSWDNGEVYRAPLGFNEM